MSDNKISRITSNYLNNLNNRSRKAYEFADLYLYLNAFPFMFISIGILVALHDLFSMFLLRSTKNICRLMAWGGIGKIVFIRWMLLIPAIFFTVLFTSFFVTLSIQTCDDGDKLCTIELINYKMIFVGIILGLFFMAIFYTWKCKMEGSVEYLMIASLMDPNGEGRSKFLDECKNSKEFKDIMTKQNT